MATVSQPRMFPATLPTTLERPARTLWGDTLHRLWRDPLTVVAICVLGVWCCLALLADPIAALMHTSPDRIDLLNNFSPPSGQHWLGTDDYGRDQFIRLLYGARVSLSIGLLAALVNLTLGVIIGAVAAFYGGLIDDLVVWFVNTFRSIPTFFLLLAISALVKTGPAELALIIGFTTWTGAARLVRGQVFQLKQRDYVLAARALGAGNARLIFRHIIPNVLSLVVVILGIDIGGVILAESGLSYLGFGVQPPVPSWGNMLTNAQSYFTQGAWLVVGPGVAIALTVWCLYTVGDGFRDAIDPRSAAPR